MRLHELPVAFGDRLRRGLFAAVGFERFEVVAEARRLPVEPEDAAVDDDAAFSEPLRFSSASSVFFFTSTP
jgi:hypothetical protein